MDKHAHENRLVQETPAGQYLFVWEEYWEEDDAGFCCVDYVLEKHTRLLILDRNRRVVRLLPLDSGNYDKSLQAEDGCVTVVYHPAYNQEKILHINAETLEIS